MPNQGSRKPFTNASKNIGANPDRFVNDEVTMQCCPNCLGTIGVGPIRVFKATVRTSNSGQLGMHQREKPADRIHRLLDISLSNLMSPSVPHVLRTDRTELKTLGNFRKFPNQNESPFAHHRTSPGITKPSVVSTDDGATKGRSPGLVDLERTSE